MLNGNNQIGIIAEVGGFWDIGDRHVAVPFEQIAFTAEGVPAPLSEDNVDEFDLFGNQGFVSAAAFEPGRGKPGVNWRLTELINDYTALNPGSGFGYVDDVAYPFNAYAHGWRPGDTAWQLPYSEQDATGLNGFNYDQYDAQLSS